MIWKRKRKSWINWRQRWTSSWGTSTQHLTRYRWGNIFTLNLEQWRDLWQTEAVKTCLIHANTSKMCANMTLNGLALTNISKCDILFDIDFFSVYTMVYNIVQGILHITANKHFSLVLFRLIWTHCKPSGAGYCRSPSASIFIWRRTLLTAK